MAEKNWKDYPAGSKQRYDAAKSDPSVSVGPFMNGDFRIRPASKTQKSSRDPWHGDRLPGASKGASPRGDQRDMGPNPPKNAKSEALKRMLKKKKMK